MSQLLSAESHWRLGTCHVDVIDAPFVPLPGMAQHQFPV